MSKVHLFDSPLPIKEGSTQVALCLALIPNAVFVDTWKPGEWDLAEISSLTFCGKCLGRLQRTGEYSYLYALKSGEEVKQEAAA